MMHDTTLKFVRELARIHRVEFDDLNIIPDGDESILPMWEVYISYNGSADEEFSLGNTHLVRELMAFLATHCGIEASIEQATSKSGDIVDWTIEAYPASRFPGENPIYRLTNSEDSLVYCSWNRGGDPATNCDALIDNMDLLCHKHRKASAELMKAVSDSLANDLFEMKCSGTSRCLASAHSDGCFGALR